MLFCNPLVRQLLCRIFIATSSRRASKSRSLSIRSSPPLWSLPYLIALHSPEAQIWGIHRIHVNHHADVAFDQHHFIRISHHPQDLCHQTHPPIRQHTTTEDSVGYDVPKRNMELMERTTYVWEMVRRRYTILDGVCIASRWMSLEAKSWVVYNDYICVSIPYM